MLNQFATVGGSDQPSGIPRSWTAWISRTTRSSATESFAAGTVAASGLLVISWAYDTSACRMTGFRARSRASRRVSAFEMTTTKKPIRISAYCTFRLYQPETRSIPLLNHVSISWWSRSTSPPARSMSRIRVRRSALSAGNVSMRSPI